MERYSFSEAHNNFYPNRHSVFILVQWLHGSISDIRLNMCRSWILTALCTLCRLVLYTKAKFPYTMIRRLFIMLCNILRSKVSKVR